MRKETVARLSVFTLAIESSGRTQVVLRQVIFHLCERTAVRRGISGIMPITEARNAGITEVKNKIGETTEKKKRKEKKQENTERRGARVSRKARDCSAFSGWIPG